MSLPSLMSIMNGQDRSVAAQAARLGLAALAPFYGAAVAGRNLCFGLGLRRTRRLPHPVLSVGNLTAGGTGKTPMVVELVRRLGAMGQHPAILLRGYGALGEASGSDEAAILAEQTGAAVAANPDRAAGARQLLAQSRQISVFVLDDGYQHRQVHRDLDLLLIDATVPFGFGHLMPRGLLRESPRGARRADAVIVTHAEQSDPARLADLDRQIAGHASRPPIAHAEHTWTGFRRFDGERWAVDALAGRRVAAFCGIGNPAAFAGMLESHVKELVQFRTFPDHHPYTATDLTKCIDAASEAAAEALVTTEKDWVKIRSVLDWSRQPVPLHRAVLELVFRDGEDQVDLMLERFLNQSAPRTCGRD